LNPVKVTLRPEPGVAEPLEGYGDLRRVAGDASLGGEFLKAAPSAVERLPMLPEIAHEVLAMLGDPETSIRDLSRVIEQDTVIAVKVLQVANSPLYGGLEPITDLTAACARLGLRNVADAVQLAASGRIYVTNAPGFKEMMLGLREHAVATACAARELARMLAVASDASVFAMGLLHSVGAVMILDLVGNQLPSGLSEETQGMLRQSPKLLEEIVGSYTGLLGLHILQAWDLPAEFSLTAFCQSNPSLTPSPHWLPIVHTVRLASVIAEATLAPEEAADAPSLTTHPSAKFLGLNDMKLAVLRADLEEQAEALAGV
jgi:HD-like signal output (HDOD) protein